MDSNKKIDEDLYSRQFYVIGHDAMVKIMSMEILILGCDGLGQEIAKNICLAGIRSIHLYDKNPVTIHSLGSGFFFSKNDLGKPRDLASLNRLKSLNKYVYVSVADTIEIEKYNIIVSVNQTLDENLRLNDICHSKGIKFLMANASGFFTQLFCDFQEYLCNEKNGQQYFTGAINDITTDGILTFVNGILHTDIDDNDTVKLTLKKNSISGETNAVLNENTGITNNNCYKIHVLNRTQVKLIDYKSDNV